MALREGDEIVATGHRAVVVHDLADHAGRGQAGQARQVDELAESVRIFEALSLPDFGIDEEIDAGALVGAALNGETTFFLLVPAAGGMVISHDGREITLLTPESALYRKLLGMRAGESLELPALTVIEVS